MRFGWMWMAAVVCAVAPLGAGAQASSPPAWLRYAIPPDPPRYHDMPHAVVQLGDAPEEATAADELDRGLGHMVAGTDHLLRRFDPKVDSIVLGTTEALRHVRYRLLGNGDAPLNEDGYRIRHVRNGPRQWWVLEGGSPRAEMYAAFRFAALVAEDRQLPDRLVEQAKIPLRALDLRGDLGSLTTETGLPVLGRLMASVGLNGLIVDGSGAMTPQAVLAVLRPYGIRIWFRGVSAEAADGAGVVVHDAAEANAAARVLRRRGGSVLLEDAGSARGLEPNVMVLRDAVPASLPMAGLASPEFAAGGGEAQVAAFSLYPAGERVAVFPATVWQSALRTPEREGETLADVVAKKVDGQHGGVVARLSVDEFKAMLEQPLMQANLFGFGRVAFNPAENADDIADAWARQTFGDDARVFGVAKNIVLKSADAYTQVTSPFGLPWLGDGGRPEPGRAARRYGIGQLASATGVGVERPVSGYPAGFAAELGNVSRVPERWLLATHRVPVTHRLADGKTVVQAFYDAHFAGAAAMVNAVDAWEETRELVDPERFAAVREALQDSSRHGEIWRDAVTEWMQAETGVPDELGFVGNHAGRVEAERMRLTGFAVRPAAEREDASGGAYVACAIATCTAETVFESEANVYRIEVGYFGRAAGGSLEVRVNGLVQARWPVEVAAGMPASATAERFAVNGVRLKPGDRIQVVGSAPVDFADITRDPRWN